METTKQLTRTLIHEDEVAIKQMTDFATNNVAQLNAIYQMKKFKTTGELLELKKNRVTHTQVEYSKRFPGSVELSQMVEIKKKIPEDLQSLEDVLGAVTNSTLEYVCFNPLKNKWEPDEDALNNLFDSRGYRKYATTEEHHKRLKLAQDYAAFVNSLPSIAKQKFSNSLLIIYKNGIFIPSWGFIEMETKY